MSKEAMFKVSFQCSESMLGKVLASASGMVEKLDVGMIKTVPFQKNKPMTKTNTIAKSRTPTKRPKGLVSGTEVVIEALMKAKDHSLTNTEAMAYYASKGFVPGGYYPIKAKLVEQGKITYDKDNQRITLIQGKH
jgi:hypothetical protein